MVHSKADQDLINQGMVSNASVTIRALTGGGMMGAVSSDNQHNFRQDGSLRMTSIIF